MLWQTERKYTKLKNMKIRSVLLTVIFVFSAFGGCSHNTEEQVPEIRVPQGKADELDPIRPEDCPGGAPKLAAGRPAAWTIMVYQAGDNNLEDYLDADLAQMEMGYRKTDQVNVLVQQDKELEDGVWRYRVRHNNDPEVRGSELVGYSSVEPDTGNWQTLAAFGEWATVCYPAEHYMLIVSGHGTGWSETESGEDGEPIVWEDLPEDEEDDSPTPQDQDGADNNSDDSADEDDSTNTDRMSIEAEGEPYRAIAYDDTSGSSLNLKELATALEYISDAARRDYDPHYINRLVIYGSDACLMQTVEVTSALGNAVTYVVGSEKTEPAQGWPYSTILRDLTARPFAYARAPQDLTKLIVEKYGIAYGPNGGQGHKKDQTLSSVNLDHSRRLVNDMTKIASLLTELREESETGYDLDQYIWAARDDTPIFSATYVDLAEFLMNLREKLIEVGLMPRKYQHWYGDERFRTLRKTIDEATLEIFDMTLANLDAPLPTPDGKPDGVSIYFPDWKYSYVLHLENYLNSPFSQKTGWGSLIENLIENRYSYY